jgi:hypothetical protein
MRSVFVLIVLILFASRLVAQVYTVMPIKDTAIKPEMITTGKQFQSKSALKSVSVKQQIETGLNKIMDNYKESPSIEAIWSNIRNEVNNFLYPFFKTDKLPGTKPQQAYSINIGMQTMTAQDIALHKKILLVGLAIIKPAEFEIISIERMPGKGK